MKSYFKSFFRVFGLEIHRYSVDKSDQARLMAMLKEHDINIVLDVGASVGLFGESLRRSGYKESIVAFEPLSDSYKKLLKRSGKDPLWHVAPRGAIGEENREIEINIAGNSSSSSILSMLDTHVKAAPHSKYIAKETVPMYTLDSIATKYMAPDSKLFIKIDTQGYEHLVLHGAKELLKQAVGLQLEISMAPLYEGQVLYYEMVEKLSALGFYLWGVSTVLIDPDSGRALQVDAVFFRFDQKL